MRKSALLWALLILVSLHLRAVEINKEGWGFPNPNKAAKKAIQPIDTTARIAGPETVVKTYQNQEKRMVFDTFEIDGEVFACQIFVRGEEGEPAAAYAIVDSDGDGVFETKYGAGERPATPEWVIRRYFKKHPDLEDPGPSVDASR